MKKDNGYRRAARSRSGRLSEKSMLTLAGIMVVLALGSIATAAWFSLGSKAADGVVIATGSTTKTGTTASQQSLPAETRTAPEELAAFEQLSFPAAFPNPARTLKLPILMFHHAGETPAGADELRQGLTVSTADLEAQMAYLKQAGYQPVTEAQLFKALYSGEALPAKPVMLTFDDGYTDNYQVVAPILEKYGFTATFYIITDMVGNPEHMTWEQVVALDRKGMDIGSHSATHPDLTTIDATSLQTEVAG